MTNNEDAHHIASEYPSMKLLEYSGKQKELKELIDRLERIDGIEDYCLHFENFLELKKDFKSNYRTVKAAGGLVKNEFDEFLFIFRRGMWDLPKGKMEKGESKEQTAVREVEEETGVRKISIEKPLGKTLHTYKNRVGARIIKKSYWFLMKATKQHPIPETSEDIQKAEWMNIQQLYQLDRPFFRNVFDVVDTHTKDIKPKDSAIF